MCYSESASWVALLVGVSGTVAFALERRRQEKASKDDRSMRGETVAIVLAMVSLVLMQFYEAFMWRNLRLHQGAGGTVERCAMITNMMQPAILATGMLTVYYSASSSPPHSSASASPSSSSPTLARIVAAILVVYVIMCMYAGGRRFDRIRGVEAPLDCNLTHTSCRLRWDWVECTDDPSVELPTAHWMMYMVLLAAGISLVRSRAIRYTFLAIAFGTLIFSMFFLDSPRGSKWCFFASILPWALFVASRQTALAQEQEDFGRTCI